MTDEPTAEFIEGLALVLTRAGMPRMASRVFAAILASDSGDLTAKEIGDALDVSAAAVSGAVGYLTRTGLAIRGRTPGARVDHYAVHDTTWAEAIATESRHLGEMSAWLSKGAEAADPGSAVRSRLDETRAFFDFVAKEMPLMIERWRTSRRA